MTNNTGEWFSYFIQQVRDGKMKSTEELVCFLRRKFDVIAFPLDGMSKSFLAAHKFNARHSYGAVLTIEPLSFQAYKILRTQKSEIYFSKITDYSALEFPVESPNEKDLLLFLYEETTNYFWINNSYLHCELIVERGINPEHISEKNLIIQEYNSSKHGVQDYENKIKNE